MAIIANELEQIIGNGESNFDASKNEAPTVSHPTNTNNG